MAAADLAVTGTKTQQQWYWLRPEQSGSPTISDDTSETPFCLKSGFQWWLIISSWNIYSCISTHWTWKYCGFSHGCDFYWTFSCILLWYCLSPCQWHRTHFCLNSGADSIGFPTVEIRVSSYCLIFTIGFPLLVRHIHIESEFWWAMAADHILKKNLCNDMMPSGNTVVLTMVVTFVELFFCEIVCVARSGVELELKIV